MIMMMGLDNEAQALVKMQPNVPAFMTLDTLENADKRRVHTKRPIININLSHIICIQGTITVTGTWDG